MSSKLDTLYLNSQGILVSSNKWKNASNLVDLTTTNDRKKKAHNYRISMLIFEEKVNTKNGSSKFKKNNTKAVWCLHFSDYFKFEV